MFQDNVLMPRRSKKPDEVPGSADPSQPKKPDRHKPRKMIGLRMVLARQLDILAEREATDTTELVNRAVKEMLQREGLWPPKTQEG